MKKIILSIFKEIGIVLGILVILAAVVVVAFKDQLPYDEEVRSGEKYVNADLKSYSVNSSDRISEVTAVTITHEAESNQILEAENEVRIQTGKPTPFGNISDTSDLPVEKVGTTIKIDADSNTSTDNSSSSEENNDLEYPTTDDPVKKLDEEQSQDPEKVANQRFNNN